MISTAFRHCAPTHFARPWARFQGPALSARTRWQLRAHSVRFLLCLHLKRACNCRFALSGTPPHFSSPSLALALALSFPQRARGQPECPRRGVHRRPSPPGRVPRVSQSQPGLRRRRRLHAQVPAAAEPRAVRGARGGASGAAEGDAVAAAMDGARSARGAHGGERGGHFRDNVRAMDTSTGPSASCPDRTDSASRTAPI